MCYYPDPSNPSLQRLLGGLSTCYLVPMGREAIIRGEMLSKRDVQIKMSSIIPGSVTTWTIRVLLSAILGIVGISAAIMVPSVLDLFGHKFPSADFLNASEKMKD